MSADLNQPLRIEYTSSSNITFHGTIEAGHMTLGEYLALSDKDRQEVLQDELNNLVELYVPGEE